MAVTEREMKPWCETLLAGREAAPDLTLADYLRAIPGLAALEGLPSGTPVLVRGDVDAKPGDTHRRRRHPASLDGGHFEIRRRSAAGSRSSSATSAASRKARSPKWPSGSASCSSATCR